MSGPESAADAARWPTPTGVLSDPSEITRRVTLSKVVSANPPFTDVADRPIHYSPVEFWFVWTKTGRLPKHTHSTWLLAAVEAERLARKHPGKKFIVLRAEGKIWTQPA